MNSPTVFTSKSILFWVALFALATLVAPAYAQVTPVANPTSVGFNYIQRTQCNPCSTPVQFTIPSGAATVTSVVITQPTSPAAVPIFIYQIAGSTVYFGLDQGIPLYNLSYNLPAGTYAGSALVTVQGGGTVAVPLSITANQSLNFTVSPSSLPAFQIPVGGFTNAQNITVSANGSTTNFTAVTTTTSGGSWLLVNGTFSFTGSTGVGSVNLSISINNVGLAAGTYYGNVAITPSNGTAVNVPITLIVGSGFTSLTANPSSFSLSATSGATGIQTQSLYLYSSTFATNYNAYFTTNPCNCVSVNPTSGVFSGGTAYLNVTANPTNISNGTYSANLHVQASDGSAVDIPITFTVGTGGTSGLSLSPTAVSFFAPTINLSPGAQTVSLSTSVSGVSYTAYVSSSSGWLQISGSTSGVLTPGISNFFSVYANTVGLAQSTYSGAITVTTSGGISSNQVIPVTLTVGSGGGGSFGGTVAPTALNFVGQAGAANAPGPQFLGVGGSGVLYSVSSATSSGSGWLTAQDQTGGTAPGFIRVSVATAGLSAGTYSGTVNVIVSGSTIPIAVTLTLTSGPSVIANPGGLYYNFTQTGQVASAGGFYQLTMSDNSSGTAFTLTSSAAWVQPNVTAGTLPTNIAFTLDNTGLPGGLNNATVTVAANGQNIVIPIVVNNLYGTGGGGTSGPLTISPASVAFNLQSTSGVQTQTILLYASTFVSYTATTSANWLGVSPTSAAINGGSSTSLFITASPAGLAGGTYSGIVTLTVNGINQTIPVSLTVGGGSSTLTFSPASLSFTYAAGGAAPSAQSVQVASTSGSITFNTGVTTSSGGNWLAVTPGTGGTTSNIQVSIVANVLTTAGTYSGTVTVTPVNGSAQSIPVTVTVSAPPTVSATPSTLTFSYRAGDAAPNAQQISVSASNSTSALTFTANPVTQSGGNWLSVSPTTGQTPATLAVNITPGALDPGTYTGTITVAGVNGAQGSSTTTVTLTVTAPLPTITRVVNEASGASGALCPGEIIRIVGTAIGPNEPAYGVLDSATNRWQTTVGGVQVLINGLPSPVIAASATQVTAVVPYEVAGRLDAFVQIRFRGSTSNAITLPVTSTQPGIFTQNFTGTGPGAILNDNGSVNGPSNPAAKSTATQPSFVVIYATGDGLERSPSGASAATGQVINVVSINDLPRPLLPVAAQIDGQPCNVVYSGAVGGQIAGLFQVNVQVPPTVSSGNVAVVISVGTNSSQTGVTVSIR